MFDSTTKTIKCFAVIDLILGTVLVSPYLGVWTIELLHSLTAASTLPIDTFHAFLLKVLGAMTILWAMVRLRHTAVWQIQFDCFARLFILAVMIFYYYHGLNVLIFFMLTEFAGLYQLLVYYKRRQ